MLSSKFNLVFIFCLALLLYACPNQADLKIPDVVLTVESFELTIAENPAANQVLGKVKATTSKGELIFKLTNQKPTGALTIDVASGELKVAIKSLFDFETNPTLTATAEVKSGEVSKTADVKITLTDVDEKTASSNDTVVTAQNFELTLAENPIPNRVLGKVKATTNKGELIFKLTQQKPPDAFRIEVASGELKVADSSLFDFETNPILTATVEVKSGGVSKTATIKITLTDVDERVDPTPSPVLVSSKLVGSKTALILQLLAGAVPELNAVKSKLKHDIEYYVLTYRSIYKGKLITASGLVSIPKNSAEAFPIISVHHGTISKHDQAPSVDYENTSNLLFTGLASLGYIIVMPDYFGLGSSKNILHPYIESKHSAQAVVDLIKATKEFVKTKKVKASDKLFLTGYSEGGYVTGAALRAIETENIFKVTASAVGAGAIDLVDIASIIVKGKTYDVPAYLPYVALSYRSVYDWPNPITDFFAPAYSQVANYFDGTKDIGDIGAFLTTDMEKLLSAKFLKALSDRDQSNVLIKALIDNSWHTYKPKSPVRVYHGTLDKIVAYSSSKKYVDNIRSQGATNVEFVSIPDKDHSSASRPMIVQTIEWFESLR